MKSDHPSPVAADRVACPWLISRFIDSEAAFLFVPAKRLKGGDRRRGPFPSLSERGGNSEHAVRSA